MPREVEYMNLLVIEDDRKLNRMLCEILEKEGYTVKACTDGEEGAYYLQQNAYDLALVDWMLPGESGPDILRESRRKGIMTPVVMLTALTAVENKVTCLDAGADDYLTKPFHLAELNARIKCIIRRKQQDGEMHINLANIIVYPDRHAVYINEEELVLNRKEFDLLYYFVTNPDRLISKGALAESIWGDYIDQADSFDFIYSQVKNLRKKLKSAGATAEIKAVYGFGYKMVNEE